jgi:hypothetical protein
MKHTGKVCVILVCCYATLQSSHIGASERDRFQVEVLNDSHDWPRCLRHRPLFGIPSLNGVLRERGDNKKNERQEKRIFTANHPIKSHAMYVEKAHFARIRGGCETGESKGEARIPSHAYSEFRQRIHNENFQTVRDICIYIYIYIYIYIHTYIHTYMMMMMMMMMMNDDDDDA